MNSSPAPRRHLEAIFRAAVAAVDPARLVARALEGQIAGAGSIPALIADSPRIFLLAVGKASLAMASEVERRIGDRLAAALAVVPNSVGHTGTLRIAILPGGHPLPDASSEAATRAALAMLSDASATDLVVVALSGGASAMFAAPAQGITLDDKIAVTSAMLRASASIREFNTVRKHLSAVKGGRLLHATSGARVLGLVLSDVPGNDLATIGSGLTCADPTTFADAIAVLKRRSIWGRAPERVRDLLERGVAGEIAETVKNGDPVLSRVSNLVIGDNRRALDAAAGAAAELGYTVDRWRELHGEADDLGRALAAHLAAISAEPGHSRQPICIIAGGEPVVTVRGRGRGGRAQQCVLSLAIELGRIAPGRRIAAMLAGTDGIDGPTDAAGAIATPDTCERATAAGFDAAASLRRNDAYPLFAALGDLLIIGPTGTNVGDIFIGLANY
jgi:glycerate 2-kinase